MHIYNKMVILCGGVRGGGELALSPCWIDSSGAAVGCVRTDAQAQARARASHWLELGGHSAVAPAPLSSSRVFCLPAVRRPPARRKRKTFLPFQSPTKSPRNCLSTRTDHFSGGKHFFRVRRRGSLPITGSRSLFNGSQRSGSTVGIKLHLSSLHSTLFFPDWVLWLAWRGKWSSQCCMPFCLF